MITTMILAGCLLIIVIVISMLVGASLDTATQREARRRVADERRHLASELRKKDEWLDGELARISTARCARCGTPL